MIGSADWIVKLIEAEGQLIQEVKNGIINNPEVYAMDIPEDFILRTQIHRNHKITNNLPPMDYEYDGGFVGRRSERWEIKKFLLDKRRHPVITISGAGGVGKTALVHYVCEEIVQDNPESFDGLVWISAKKDRLTLTGIEDIEPTAETLEELLNEVLEFV